MVYFVTSLVVAPVFFREMGGGPHFCSASGFAAGFASSGEEGVEVWVSRVVEPKCGDVISEGEEGGGVGATHPFGDRFLQAGESDLGAIGIVEPGGGHDGGEADARVVVCGGFGEEVGAVRNLCVGVTEHLDGGSAGAEVW